MVQGPIQPGLEHFWTKAKLKVVFPALQCALFLSIHTRSALFDQDVVLARLVVVLQVNMRANSGGAAATIKHCAYPSALWTFGNSLNESWHSLDVKILFQILIYVSEMSLEDGI